LIPQFPNASEEFKRQNPHIFALRPEPDTLPPVKDELSSKGDLRQEKQLQVQILNLLRLKGIQVLWHRTDKKTTGTVGWPDLTFAVECGLKSVPVGMEVKLPGRKLSPEQQRVAVEMMAPPNSWQYHVVTSVDEVLHILRKLGIH
jgi:hypothetical protein